jgi:hypothetical protein
VWLHSLEDNFLEDTDNGLTLCVFPFCKFSLGCSLVKKLHCFLSAVLPLSWSTSISLFFTVVESSLKQYDQGKKNQRDRRVALGRGSVRTRGQTLWFSTRIFVLCGITHHKEFIFVWGGGGGCGDYSTMYK